MSESAKPIDIVCLSHLKWEHTLFQRPQQIMRRLSESRKVVYVARCSTREFLRSVLRGDVRNVFGKDNPNLVYLNFPYLPFTRHIKSFEYLKNFGPVLAALLLRRMFGLGTPHLWLYHPAYVHFLQWIRREKLIYDCMDLFQGFASAEDKVGSQERRLIEEADIVFTGGKSLQRAKQGVNPRTHCFPSGVDFDHFGKARLDETPIPGDVAGIPRPILGYFGAVDERIDFTLLNRLCEKRPDWSVVFIGPLIRYHFPPIDQPNFHYLGKKNYAELPGYLKSFDVCLMPFTISELTRHISPTKTPEYLSGGKPVVSTAIPDVIEDYSDVVKIAEDYDSFIAHVEQALGESGAAGHEKLRAKAEAKSWEHIASEMERLIREL